MHLNKEQQASLYKLGKAYWAWGARSEGVKTSQPRGRATDGRRGRYGLAVGSPIAGAVLTSVSDDECTITGRLSLGPPVLTAQRWGRYVSQAEGRGFESHRPLQIQEENLTEKA